MPDAFQKGAFQPFVQVGDGAPDSAGTFDTGIFDQNIFDNVLGPMSSDITGTLAVTLGAVTVSSASKLTIDGDASITLGTVTVSSASRLTIDGDAAITLGTVAVSSAAKLAIDGDASITLGAVTLSSAGKLTIDGDAAITLGTVTLSSAAKLALAATSSITLGSVGLSSAGNLPIDADLSVTLGDVTLEATGTGASGPIEGTLAVTLGDIILLATGTGPAVASGFGGWAHAGVHRQGDTRWDGVREAREEARRLFDDVAATTPAKRKKAAAKASEAVANVAKSITPPASNVAAKINMPFEAWDSVLEDLLQLQAYLAGLAEQERIAKAEAREAAERWAMIERELAAEAFREEELMIVMALAL